MEIWKREPESNKLEEADRYVSQGFSLLSGGDLADALRLFDDALAIDSGNYGALKGKGAAYFQMKNYPEAIRSFKDALAIRADDREIRQSCASALLAIGRTDDAIGVLNLAFHQDALPDLKKLVQELFTRKLYPEALDLVDRLTALDTGDARLWCMRGLILCRLSRLNQSGESGGMLPNHPDDTGVWYL
ncbi:MAG: TPR repeat-containing protein, partial [Methanomicrobiales archaeon 53_19]